MKHFGSQFGDSPKLFHSLIVSALLFISGCSSSESENGRHQAAPPPADAQTVKLFCGDCHAYPHPDTFPAERWEHEVLQGFQFYRDSGRTDLEVPPVEAVVAYYQANAPQALKIPLPDSITQPQGPVLFRKQDYKEPHGLTPAISHILFLPPNQDRNAELLISDMRSSLISRLPDAFNLSHSVDLAEVPNPAHVESCDLNADGSEEFLISSLGTFMPSDEKFGALVWAQLGEHRQIIRTQYLLENVPRIADAKTGDADGDGDEDIFVAIFGWRQTGRLVWLEQVDSSSDQLRFEEHELDSRHGCSHIFPIDIDADQDLDLITLFSQEHESIVLFLNDGQGEFRKQTIYTAHNPSYGSSSIWLTDLDCDGDQDILFTNGDSFDTGSMKPYHGVQWIEQLEGLQFEYHRLADLPGAYGVRSGDLDQDGDQDIVACSMTFNAQFPFTSLLLLEQIEEKKFREHHLTVSRENHACLELVDLDQDEDLDILTGHFEPRNVTGTPWMSVLWNDGPRDLLDSSD